MPSLGAVRLVVSKEEDGFHLYVTNWLDWADRRVVEAYRIRQAIDVFYRDVMQNLGLGDYLVRRS